MQTGLKSSTIEVMRVRNHGKQYIRLYKLNADGNTLSIIGYIYKGFFIGSNRDTAEGAAEFLMTIDIGYTEGLTEATLQNASWMDLINPDTQAKRRFSLNTGGPPLLDNERFIFGLHAKFNDTKAIV